MPRGVTDQFLKILKTERRTSLRTSLLMLALALPAYFMAELTDNPPFGEVVLLSLLALGTGLALGLLWGARRTRKYNESLRTEWNAWMRMSLSSTRIDEVARRVASRERPPALSGLAWATLLLGNAALFAILWTEQAWGIYAGVGVAAANGIVLGCLAGNALWNVRWTARFSSAIDDLVQEGQIGMWGER